MSASGTVVLRGISTAMVFGLTVLLARLLGSDGYGRYALAIAWSSLLIIPAILGLDRFLVRGIAVYEMQDKWSLMKGLLRRTNQLVLLTSTLIAACGVTTALAWLSPSIRAPFCVSMLLVPLAALTLLRQGTMQAIGRVVTGQLPEFLIRPLVTIALVVALELGNHRLLSPTTAVAANVGGVAVAFVVGAVLLRRALPAVLRAVRPEYTTRRWLSASLPMMLISGTWMASAYATTLVVGTMDGPRAAGLYSVSQKGAELIAVVLLAANLPLAPVLARLHAQRDSPGIEHMAERTAKVTILASAPIAIALIAFPGTFLGLLFGPGFQSGATALRILAFGQFVNAAAGPSGNVLIMTGQERIALRGVAAGLFANVLLAIALVPPLGVTGGAIAFASGLVLWNVVLVVLARRRLGVNVTAFHRLACRGA